MFIPTIVAVAKLSQSSRRLLAAARSLAIEAGAPSLEGFHLFLAAARMEKTRAGRLLPSQTKLFLAKASIEQTHSEETGIDPFLPISPVVQEACCSLAESSPKVLPEAILSRVFKEDVATRTALKGVLRPDLFRQLEDRMLLAGFSATERKQLLRLRDRSAGERNDESGRD